MALIFGSSALHLHPAPHALSSHSTMSLLPLSTSSAISLHHAPFCKRSRIMCSQHKSTIKLKPDIQHLSSLFRDSALVGVPLVVNLLLPSVATALGSDQLSTSHQVIHFIALVDLDPAVAGVLMRVLGPVFASLNFLFIIRIVMSWYPQLPVDKFPFVIAYAPTEPVLEPTRKLIPPVGGVDVSPVIWVALMSFFNEILLGQQGLLVLLSQQQG